MPFVCWCWRWICLIRFNDVWFVVFLLDASVGYAGLQSSEVYRLSLLPSKDWTFRFSTATSGRWDRWDMAFVSAWMQSPKRSPFLLILALFCLPACFLSKVIEISWPGFKVRRSKANDLRVESWQVCMTPTPLLYPRTQGSLQSFNNNLQVLILQGRLVTQITWFHSDVIHTWAALRNFFGFLPKCAPKWMHRSCRLLKKYVLWHPSTRGLRKKHTEISPSVLLNK